MCSSFISNHQRRHHSYTSIVLLYALTRKSDVIKTDTIDDHCAPSFTINRRSLLRATVHIICMPPPVCTRSSTTCDCCMRCISTNLQWLSVYTGSAHNVHIYKYIFKGKENTSQLDRYDYTHAMFRYHLTFLKVIEKKKGNENVRL